jgi:hypothetical protein
MSHVSAQPILHGVGIGIKGIELVATALMTTRSNEADGIHST